MPTLERVVSQLLVRIRLMIGKENAADLRSLHLAREFEQYGYDAHVAGLSLDETMTGAITALRQIFDDFRDTGDGPITLAAGSALTAVSEGYRKADAGQARSSALDDSGSAQINQLRALHRISRAVTTIQRPVDLLDFAVRVIADATDSDACAVFLYDEATNTLGLWAAVGLNPGSIGALSLYLGEGITGLAGEQRAPIVAADAQRHPSWVEAHNFGDGMYVSQASVPMMIEEPSRLIGVLNVLSTERRDPTNEDIDFLRTVANELALGVEFSRLRNLADNRLRRKIAELGTLQRVSRTVASSLSLADVLPLIAEAAAELSNAEAAALFRLPARIPGNDQGQVPVIEYRVGLSRDVAKAADRDDFVQKVIESGVAQVTDLEFTDGYSRLYCLPIRSARERWGALCIRLKPGGELDEDELALLQAFTDSASIAIENAQLYRNARNSAETASALLQEMHHRVRNNLQTLAALLSLQMRQVDDPRIVQQLREAAGRIQAIAAVHDLLSDEQRLGEASIDAIARLVVEQANVTQKPPELAVDFHIPPSRIVVPSRQATILALLINELISNAITHGFRGRSSGTISIESGRRGSKNWLSVTNDGHQIPDSVTTATSKGLGLRIVERLAQSDLGGTFTIGPGAGGTVAEITFPAVAGQDQSAAASLATTPA
ncbi:MAG: GAF domain-containing protein [Thermomicrobiales bacterium]|nr:GAF domain-containing protein [Thermomicrobiales bacterium]